MLFARMARVSASSPLARRCASTIGVRIPPTSVEWMLEVTSTTTFPSAMRRARSSGARSRGSASLRWISR